MSTAAVLPVKRFGEAKQRLGDLGAGLRRALAEAMLADVLGALVHCSGVAETIVVTNEPLALQAAAAHGVRAVAEPPEPGHSPAAALGAALAAEHGHARAVLVPLDCPALAPADVEELLAVPAAPPSVVVVPDRHGTGTNALVLSPPAAIAPAFGPGSRERHLALARAAGAAGHVAEIASLALDVDTPADLDALRAALAALPPDRAPATRALLQGA